MVVGGMFIAEVSNPPMHVRIMLKHLGLRYSKAYESMEITFILLYSFGRIFLGSYQVWSVQQCEAMGIIPKFASLALMAQSVFFVH